jgi:hypothetical protein
VKLVQEHDDDDETDSKDCKLGRSQEQVLTSTNTSAMEHRKGKKTQKADLATEKGIYPRHKLVHFGTP